MSRKRSAKEVKDVCCAACLQMFGEKKILKCASIEFHYKSPEFQQSHKQYLENNVSKYYEITFDNKIKKLKQSMLAFPTHNDNDTNSVNSPRPQSLLCNHNNNQKKSL